jgi:fumarylacetoacetase
MQAALDESWSWTSWVSSANDRGCDFPLQNLPYCAFESADGEPHLGVGIGSYILDLHECVRAGLLKALPEETCKACSEPSLNGLMRCGREAASHLRRSLMLLLKSDANPTQVEAVRANFRPIAGTSFRKPVVVGNYTDFYASIHHATNVGRLFRPDQPLLPNYKFVPIGYHGRASSIVVSDTPVVRPWGQTKLPSEATPGFRPSGQMDYELEVGAYIGMGNRLGRPIGIADAERHLFGITLVNDWSARDVQAWENQPLGPFLGKSFATTVSPWVVSLDALEPFRVALAPRDEGEPDPLPYLESPAAAMPAIDLKLAVHLSTRAMREKSLPPVRLSSVNFRDMYWSFAQMITHHTSNGCNLLAGDLIASGTVSGSEKGTQGSLLEMTRRGTVPLQLPDGEVRGFLEDGDEILLSGFCERAGLPRIGLGECRGRIAPAFV